MNQCFKKGKERFNWFPFSYSLLVVSCIIQGDLVTALSTPTPTDGYFRTGQAQTGLGHWDPTFWGIWGKKRSLSAPWQASVCHPQSCKQEAGHKLIWEPGPHHRASEAPSDCTAVGGRTQRQRDVSDDLFPDFLLWNIKFPYDLSWFSAVP